MPLTEKYGSSRVVGGPLVKVTELDHIGLRVKDVEAALGFYSELLGLKTERVDAWKTVEIGFPSVRLNADTLIDFFLPEKKVDNAHKEMNPDHFCLVIEPNNMDNLNTKFVALVVRLCEGHGKS